LFASSALVCSVSTNLCLLVGCSISIIWSACAGWILGEGRSRRACMVVCLREQRYRNIIANMEPSHHIAIMGASHVGSRCSSDHLYYAFRDRHHNGCTSLCHIFGVYLLWPSIRIFDPDYFSRGSQSFRLSANLPQVKQLKIRMSL
jgi:hypothetical protein